MRRTWWRRARSGWVVSTAALMVASACGGGAAETTTTVSASPTTAEVATTTARPATTTTRAEGEITLDFPAEVEGGTEFEVTWTGPDNTSDYITIVVVGADKGAFNSYFNTVSGSTGKLVAPLEAGDYEIRYVDGESSDTIASSAIKVTPYEITFEAPTEVEAGTEFEVTWTGPDGPGDYITIMAVDAGAWSGDSYFNTAATGNPAILQAPDTPGAYEIWYASDRVEGTFATISITVT